MINTYSEFFSEIILSLLDDKIKSIYEHKSRTPIFTSNISNWDKDLVGSSVPILRYILNKEDTELINLIKSEIENKLPYYVNDIIIHICPPFSYIPWHDDGGHKAALSIYLNKNWNPNWGGFFMYEDGDKICAIKPDRNLAIFQKGGTKHSVSTINLNADYRISIQCFLNSDKKIM
jgi:Rps23 Pro-64 3,4-dihydroxylase Tpa1-like proline 4-hydroxylase